MLERILPGTKKYAFILRSIWRDNKTLLVISVIQIPASVLLPYIQLFLTKSLVEGIERQYALSRYVGTIVCVFLLQLALTSVKDWMAAASEWNGKFVVNSLLKSLDQKTLCTDYGNVEGKAGQELRQKAVNAVYAFGQSMVPGLVALFANFFGLLLYGMTVGFCNVVVLVIVAATTIAGYLLAGCLRAYEQKQKDSLAECSRKMQYLEDEAVSLQAAREIRLYDMSDLILSLYRESKDIRLGIAGRLSKGKALVSSGGSLLSLIRNLAAYFYLIYLAVQGQIMVSDFVLMVGVVSGLSGWLERFMKDVGEIQRMGLYLRDYFAYLDLEETARGTARKNAGEDAAQVHPLAQTKVPKLEFVSVDFRYEGACQDVLHDINLVVRPGDRLAVVGKNGAGKTTLVKLLSGLYKPTGGKVLLDGVDIASYSREAYFAAVSAVFQDILLLPVGIRQNVSSRTEEDTDEGRVRQSLEKAGLYEKVLQLPQGMDTPMQKGVRSDGIDLSGGEQQKVMIAKAIYKEAKILILDEPTAALDSVAENTIYQKYNELSQGMTSFFISHRLASTSFCSQIILVDEGRIIEQGSHQELMELHGEYWKMFTMQSRYYREREQFDD